MIYYKKATLHDLDLLTTTRVEVLKSANQLDASADLSVIKKQTHLYYQKAFTLNSHIAYIVFDGSKFIGTGGVSFFRVMPTYHNPSGYKAYIINMYTIPSHRRKGVAYKTLELLVKEAKRKASLPYRLKRQSLEGRFMKNMVL